MKYSLSSRQKPELLHKIDEIKVAYRDKNIIPDLIEKYSQADINLVLPYGEEDIPWKEINTWNILSKGKFILCLMDMRLAAKAKELKCRFYYGVPTATHYDVNTLVSIGVEQILVTAPVFFDMPFLKNTEKKIRVIPNEAYLGDIPGRDGTYGSWINPNHIHLYEEYVYICEFNTYDMIKEKGYYSVYANLKSWGGPLKELITGMDDAEPGAANLLPEEVTVARIKCNQKCQKNGRCHICPNALHTYERKRIENYINEIKTSS